MGRVRRNEMNGWQHAWNVSWPGVPLGIPGFLLRVEKRAAVFHLLCHPEGALGD